MGETNQHAAGIPEKYKNHCMIGKYKYERFDEETGKFYNYCDELPIQKLLVIS